MDAPLLDKRFSPGLSDEPFFTFRAKDDLAGKVILAYRALLRQHNYSEVSDEIRSIDEWLNRREQWREENPELCQMPTF